MAFSTTSFHFPRSWMQVIQFLTLIWQTSCLTLSSHLYLGLPCDLLVRGSHLNIFLTVLVSGILCMWPNQLSLWALTWLTIFLCFISLSNSSLVLILHIYCDYRLIKHITSSLSTSHNNYLLTHNCTSVTSPPDTQTTTLIFVILSVNFISK